MRRNLCKIDGWIFETELQRKKIKISEAGLSKSGLRAVCACSVSVSASSKMMILGNLGPPRPSKILEICEFAKGYTLDRTDSRLRSSLLFKKRARPV